MKRYISRKQHPFVLCWILLLTIITSCKKPPLYDYAPVVDEVKDFSSNVPESPIANAPYFIKFKLESNFNRGNYYMHIVSKAKLTVKSTRDTTTYTGILLDVPVQINKVDSVKIYFSESNPADPDISFKKEKISF